MAGQFTNLIYDDEAFSEEIYRSTAPLLYKIDPRFAVNCNSCFPALGLNRGLGNSNIIGNQIDVDSIMTGRSKISSKSNREQIPDPIEPYQLDSNVLRDCPVGLEPQNSRFITPPYEIRGLTVRDMRFDYPLFDPQCQIFENFEVNTRLQAKDNHRAIWQVPLEQADLQPVRQLGKVKDCAVGLGCDYAQFHRMPQLKPTC